MLRVAAVDLGATSARVAVVDLEREPLVAEVVHRHHHQPVVWRDGTLRWDWLRLVDEVELGLSRALDGGPLESIGIDTWGVDYGLLDASGSLVAPPFAYRDARTAGWEAFADRLGRERLYRTTGIQLLAVNTVFQLAVHPRKELAAATSLLLLPELLVHHLTGVITGEVTSAGTTALVDIDTGTWSADLLADVGVDAELFPPIARAGNRVGAWRGVPVHLVGGHDTASAVAARPAYAPTASAFVSAGTWLLVGAERPAPDTSEAARLGNFSNEPAVLGGVRFLKNVNGLWLLERCRAAWGDPPVAQLVADAAAIRPGGPIVDPNDARFVNPADMEAEIRAAAGLGRTASRDVVVRCILDSLAVATAGVVAELATFLGEPVRRIDMIGGGGQIPLLVDLIADATGADLEVGPAEATAIGNAIVQGNALSGALNP